MNMYVNQLHALPPIEPVLDALRAIVLGYVLPSTLIVLSLVAVLLLDLWLIKLEMRRRTAAGRRRAAGRNPRVTAIRIPGTGARRVERTTNPGLT